MSVRKNLSERVSLEISVRTVRGRRGDWNLETSMCGESCPDILKTVQVSILLANRLDSSGETYRVSYIANILPS